MNGSRVHGSRVNGSRVKAYGVGTRPAAQTCSTWYKQGRDAGTVRRHASRTVRLGHPDHFRIWPVVHEAQYVVARRPSPAVDGLIVVGSTEDERALSAGTALAGEAAKPLVLHGTCVLQLVDKDVLVALTIPTQHLGMALEEMEAVQSQVRKVELPCLTMTTCGRGLVSMRVTYGPGLAGST